MKYKVIDTNTGKELEVHYREEIFLSPNGSVVVYYNDGSGGYDFQYPENVKVVPYD